MALVVWAVVDPADGSHPRCAAGSAPRSATRATPLTWRVDVGTVPGLRDVVGHLPGDRWATTTPAHGHVAAAATSAADRADGGAGPHRPLGRAPARPGPGRRLRRLRGLRVDLARAAGRDRRDGAHPGRVHLAGRAPPPGGAGRPAPQRPGRRRHRARRDPPVPHRRPAAPHPLARLAAHRRPARDDDLRRPGCRGAPRPRRHPRPRRARRRRPAGGRASTSPSRRPVPSRRTTSTTGDRVGLSVLGGAGMVEVPAVGGHHQLARVLLGLGRAEPSRGTRGRGARAARPAAPQHPAGCLRRAPVGPGLGRAARPRRAARPQRSRGRGRRHPPAGAAAGRRRPTTRCAR